jgi:hypothetical protein
MVLYPELNPVAANGVHIEILVLRGRSFKSFLEPNSEGKFVAVYCLGVFHAVLETARKDALPKSLSPSPRNKNCR